MIGRVYEAQTEDGRKVYREGDRVTGALTLKKTPFVFEFVMGCAFVSVDRAEKVLSQRLKEPIKAVETDRTGEYFMV
jgi:hypothetical protein